MLNAADIPNFAMIMNTKIKSSNCQKISRRNDPKMQIKKQIEKPYFAPAILYI